MAMPCNEDNTAARRRLHHRPGSDSALYPTGWALRSPVGLEVDRAAGGEALQLDDAVDRRRADRGVGGQSHNRVLPPALGADRGGDDIDALLTHCLLYTSDAADDL